MDDSIYNSCLQHLTPTEDSQALTVYKNTGEVLMS
jgi:hypothetical protein